SNDLLTVGVESNLELPSGMRVQETCGFRNSRVCKRLGNVTAQYPEQLTIRFLKPPFGTQNIHGYEFFRVSEYLHVDLILDTVRTEYFVIQRVSMPVPFPDQI